MKRGAIFDMDGTLFDTEKLYWNAWIETADTFGLERNPEMPKVMSGGSVPTLLDKIPKFFPQVDPNEYFRRVLNRVRKEIEENLEMKPGVVEILTYLKDKNFSIAIASSSDTESIRKNILRAGIEKFFDAIIGGDQVTNGKPAPDIFLLAAKKINVPPEDCYVFEDSFNGIRAASAANSAPIMVIDMVEPSSEIRKLCAGIFNNMTEALEAIKRGDI